MKRSALLYLLPLACLAACDSATAPPEAFDRAASKAAAGEPAMIPYKAHVTFALSPDAVQLICAPVQYGAGPPNRYEGGGIASHFGVTRVVITFDACTLDLTGTWLFTATGHGVQTAANGDEAWVDFTMTQYANGDFTIDQMTVTGGTGRFANATGILDGSGWLDRNHTTYPGYFDLEGTLRLR